MSKVKRSKETLTEAYPLRGFGMRGLAYASR